MLTDEKIELRCGAKPRTSCVEPRDMHMQTRGAKTQGSTKDTGKCYEIDGHPTHTHIHTPSWLLTRLCALVGVSQEDGIHGVTAGQPGRSLQAVCWVHESLAMPDIQTLLDSVGKMTWGVGGFHSKGTTGLKKQA